MRSESMTDAGLLQRLRDGGDPSAWNEFRGRYESRVRNAVQRSGNGLDEATANGLTEAVLHALRDKLPRFEYDRTRGCFRGWLETVVRNEVSTFFRPDLPRPGQEPRGGSDHHAVLEQVPDPRAYDLNAVSDSIVEELYANPRLRRLMLFHEAEQAVIQNLRNPKRWEAFWTVRGLQSSAEEAATALRMTSGALRKAVHDVEGMLTKELERRLNRLLAAARAGEPNDELGRYAGRTVDELRQAGARLLPTLQGELERLLNGLIGVAVRKEPATAVARDLGMQPIECARIANALGRCYEEELNDSDAIETGMGRSPDAVQEVSPWLTTAPTPPTTL